jgi:hypothetical protein
MDPFQLRPPGVDAYKMGTIIGMADLFHNGFEPLRPLRMATAGIMLEISLVVNKSDLFQFQTSPS